MISSALTNNLIFYLAVLLSLVFLQLAILLLHNYLSLFFPELVPTFSLLTIAIGSGALGSLNIL